MNMLKIKKQQYVIAFNLLIMLENSFFLFFLINILVPIKPIKPIIEKINFKSIIKKATI